MRTRTPWTHGWHTTTPLHLTGNTTEEQNTQLLEFLGEAVTRAHKIAMEELDQTSAQAVLESSRKLKNEATELLVELIHRHTTSERFKSERVDSDRIYPSTYRLRPIEAQVTELRKYFPTLSKCNERIARRPMLEGAEAWFAIPRWQALAETYNEAVSMVMECISSKRRFQNRIKDRMGPAICARANARSSPKKFSLISSRAVTFSCVASQFGMLASRLLSPPYTRHARGQ